MLAFLKYDQVFNERISDNNDSILMKRTKSLVYTLDSIDGGTIQ